jgi:SnoaL-like domain
MAGDSVERVRHFWERIEARDWDGARELLADYAVCRWPHSDERFEGAEAIVGMNRSYPEGWRITIVDVSPLPGGAVSRIRVDQAGMSFHCASFFRVEDGQIGEVFEYWVTEGSEEPPGWRARFSERGFGG